MFRTVLAAACVAAASAFAPMTALPRTGARAAVFKVGGLRMQDNALPFLERPPALDGSLAGDVGFDPVGFSNYFDLKWLREAELKHGRVCMLAFTGMIAQEAVCLPQFQNGATPLDDFFVVPAAGLWQVFFTIGAVEFFSNNFKVSTRGDVFGQCQYLN